MSPYKKNLFGLLAMVFIAGALGLYAFYGVKEADERSARTKDDTARLFVAHEAGERLADGGVPDTDFTKLTVEAKGERTELEKQADGSWALTSPLQVPADKEVVEGLLSTLRTTKTKSTVDESPSEDDLKKYGLSPPAMKVTATANRLGGGVTTVTIEGGVDNTFDGTMYLRRSTSPAVHQVEGGTKWTLEKGTFDLREKALVSLEEDTLAQLELKTPKHTVMIARGAEGAWQLQSEKGETAPVDPTVLANFLTTANEVSATSFPVDTPDERRRLRLDTPAYTLVATRKDGGRVQLKLGKTQKDTDPNVGALREADGSEPLLAEVPTSALTSFDKRPADFEDKTVLRFSDDQVARIRIQEGSKPALELEKAPAANAGAPGAWVVAAPQKGKARSYKVSSLLETLSSLKWLDRSEKAPGLLKSLELEPPSRRVELLDGEGKTLAVLALGTRVATYPDRVWARAGENLPVQLQGSEVSALTPTLTELMDAPAPTAAPEAADAGTTTAAPSH